LILTGKITAQYIIKEKIPHVSKTIEWIDPPLKVDISHLVISKKSKNYKQKLGDFNRGLKEITKDGTIKKIMLKNKFD